MYRSSGYLFFFLIGAISAQCIRKTAVAFENRCYEVFTTPLSWHEAEKYCSDLSTGTTLAKVTSASIMAFLESQKQGRIKYLWVGGNDIEKEGTWVWTDKTVANLTTLWGPGEPNRAIDNCLMIHSNGKLNDGFCTVPCPFVCMEKENATLDSGVFAFTVVLSKPLNMTEKDIVVFDKTFTNIGNAYANNTGVFTCPKAGLYFFQVHGVANKGKALSLALVKNKMEVVSLFHSANEDTSTAGNSAFLQLAQNDQVFVQVSSCDGGSLFSDGRNIVNTFSGLRVAD